jgi:hypothetical protein
MILFIHNWNIVKVCSYNESFFRKQDKNLKLSSNRRNSNANCWRNLLRHPITMFNSVFLHDRGQVTEQSSNEEWNQQLMDLMDDGFNR